jgi:hypothetical protein
MHIGIKAIAWMILLFFAFRFVWAIVEGAWEHWRGRHARREAAQIAKTQD